VTAHSFPFSYQPPREAEPGTEAQIQARLIAALRLRAPSVRVVSVPNEGLRSVGAAARLRATGMRAGFPDLIVLGPDGRCAFLEMKARGGSLSKEQVGWCFWLAQMGFPVAVFRDHMAACEWLRSLGFPVLAARVAA